MEAADWLKLTGNDEVNVVAVGGICEGIHVLVPQLIVEVTERRR